MPLLVALLLTLLPVAAEVPALASERTPRSEAAPTWKGLPILPGAIGGREAGLGYVYSAKVSFSEAESFYRKVLKSQVWTLSVRSQSNTSLFGGPFLSLDAKRSGQKANVVLMYSTKDEVTLVTLTWIQR